jgi:hypothetical protein
MGRCGTIPIVRKLIACDRVSFLIALGGNMTSCITGSRPRRAATFQFLFVCALAAQAGSVVAQQPGEANPFSDSRGKVYGNGVNQVPCESSYGASTHADEWGGNASCGCECGEQFWSGIFTEGWVELELLRWRLNGTRLPPLVTVGSPNANPANVARLNDPGTEILAGDDIVNEDWRYGIRVNTGIWLNCCHTLSVSADFFDLEDDEYDFNSDPGTTRVVGRPFFNTDLGIDDVEFVSVPNELLGSAGVRSNDDFRGAGLTFNQCVWSCCDPCCERESSQVNVLGGYRFYNYDSNLRITEDLTVLPGTTTPLVPGTTILLHDSFHARNEFNGAEIGLEAGKKNGWWWMEGMAKVAVGAETRTVIIDGETTTTVPNGGIPVTTVTTVNTGGLLTSEVTNIGHYHDSDFVVIPEFRFGLGATISRIWSVRAGYSVIIWGDVARAASHLPPGLEVDPRNLPPVQAGGGPEPEFPGIRGSELVAHGLDLSMVWEY